MYTDNRLIQIVDNLEKKGSMSIGDLSLNLTLSDKTIRKIINDSEDIVRDNGFHIGNKYGSGYFLIVDDKERYDTFRKDHPLENVFDHEGRMTYIIKLLLTADDYVKIEEIADEMFLSRSSIDRLIPYIKEQLNEYGLSLESKAKYGIKISGSEKDKRLYIAHLPNLDIDADVSARVQNILLHNIDDFHIRMGDNNIYNLVQHCIITLRRIRKGNVLPEELRLVYKDEYQNEIDCANRICEELSETFSIEIPAVETDYIAMHLLGKKILDNSNAISAEVFSYVDEILNEIYETKHVDLRDDTNLKTQLIFHIQPLILRMRFGLKQKNPILREVKKEMAFGYELALCASDVLERELQIKMDEDEASFLALHFTLALEMSQQNKPDKKKIYVVCGSGRGTAKLLQYRLVNKLKINANELILISSLALDRADFSDVRCILTTIPLPKKYPVPTLIIDLSVDNISVGDIDRLVNEKEKSEKTEVPDYLFMDDVDCKDKKEALTMIASYVCEQYGLDHSFIDQVLKREELSSTEQGNLLAVPHPYQYENKVFILCFARLKKPVKWKYGDVSYVVMMNFPDDAQYTHLIEKITTLVSDEQKVRKLKSSFDRNTIDHLLEDAI